MKANKYLIIGQVTVLILVGALLFMFYPRANANVDGDWVSFKGVNAKVIMISDNPDFSNPRFLDLSERNNYTFNMNPGKYYWKADNGIIEGMQNSFEIKSQVGLLINKTENDSSLVNVGNVKIKVSKDKNGVMVGQVVLDTTDTENISDNSSDKYTGSQI